MNAPPPVQSTFPPSDSDKSWIAHAREEIQKEPVRLEETAKFLVAIVSISLTIFIANRPGPKEVWAPELVAAAVLWLLSTLLGFLVMFPWRYSFNRDSPDSIVRMHRRVTVTKRVLLVGSVVCFLLALGIATGAFLAGLTG